MAIRLSFDSGPLAGIHIVTSAPMIRFGRDPASNDVLLANLKLSRRHAVLARSVRGGYTLEVMGVGPTTLNGDAVQAIGGRPSLHPLSSWDRIDFGGMEVVVADCRASLIVVSGPAAGREIAIDGVLRVGRDPDCDLVLVDPAIAAEHLVLVPTPLGFRADARAPTAFNGSVAEHRVLSHGDELVVGMTTLRFAVRVPDGPSAEASLSTSVGGKTAETRNAVGELVVIAGAAKGDKLLLGDDQIIIGTRDDCTFVLGDILASPLHSAISRNGDDFVATDLGSASGTYVNGERIFQGTGLRAGDLIAVGSHVFEARLLGGVTVAKKNLTLFSTIPPGAEGSAPRPRFVIGGRVMKARKLTFGRAPSCDVIVDGPTVSREHVAIEWKDGFLLRDTSSAGTYLDDRRVVEQPLPPQSVLRVVDDLFRISVRGEVCTVERVDAALAQAAVDVARAAASNLTRAFLLLPIAEEGHPMHLPVQQDSKGPINSPMHTVFRMDERAVEHQIAARKRDLRKGAPAWRPSSDLAPDRTLRGAASLALIAAIAVGGGSIALGGGSALVNHSLSPAHSSVAFTEQRTSTTVCGACHSAGAAVAVEKCAACHEGMVATATAVGRPHGHAGIACEGCHREHLVPIAGTGTASDGLGQVADHSLGATATCRECHAGQHATDFGAAPAGITRVAAGGFRASPLTAAALPLARSTLSATEREARLVELHVAHSRVTVGGVDQGIGCTSCHAGAAAPTGGFTEGVPGLACFRCHEGAAAATETGCERCHAREHTGATTVPMAADDPKLAIMMTAPTPSRALGWGFLLALAAGGPSLAFASWTRLRRRRLTSALVDEMKAHPAEVVKRLVHSINDSKCVGCAMCVQACPASVLELVDHKSRVVNFDSCIQCKKCEYACAFDALRMHDADKPPPMIPMPSIDAFHETPVPGMFLVGQASGTPQVKNASNLGRAAVQRIVQQGYQRGSAAALSCEVDVAIIGSGPAGLSAALTCIELGLSYTVFEKERALAWTIRNYYHKGKEVMAEPHDVVLESTLPHWDTRREDLLAEWEQLVAQYQVPIRYQTTVADVKKDGERFVLHLADAKGQATALFTAARVVIAIGTLGNPRKLGCPGDELEKVKNSLVDPGEWSGRRILVVGGSDSAVEVVLALCAPERHNQVWFSTRGAKLEGIKPKNRKLVETALAAGQFQMRYATAVAEVTPDAVALTFKEDGRREDLPNDIVFAMIGGNSPQKWLQQLGIPYVDKPHSWSPPRTDHLSAKTAEGLIDVRRLIRRAR